MKPRGSRSLAALAMSSSKWPEMRSLWSNTNTTCFFQPSLSHTQSRASEHATVWNSSGITPCGTLRYVQTQPSMSLVATSRFEDRAEQSSAERVHAVHVARPSLAATPRCPGGIGHGGQREVRPVVETLLRSIDDQWP